MCTFLNWSCRVFSPFLSSIRWQTTRLFPRSLILRCCLSQQTAVERAALTPSFVSQPASQPAGSHSTEDGMTSHSFTPSHSHCLICPRLCCTAAEVLSGSAFQPFSYNHYIYILWHLMRCSLSTDRIRGIFCYHWFTILSGIPSMLH